MTQAILRLPTVQALTGLSRASIYAYIKIGEFPAQVKIGRRSVGWHASAIDEWAKTRPLATTNQPQ